MTDLVDNGKLSYSDVTVIKAIALIMMLCHHFWGFPEWLALDVSMNHMFIGEVDVAYYIGHFCKLCVGIFAFLNGYLFFIKQENFRKVKYRIHKIIGLLVPYWVVEVIFLGMCFIGTEPFPDLFQLLSNLVGLETGMEGGKCKFCVVCILLYSNALSLSNDRVLYGSNGMGASVFCYSFPQNSC